MYKLSILRTHARRWRNTVWRSPNAADGLALDISGQLTIQPRSTATWSPMPGLPTALEAVRRPVLESFHPTVPYLRPLSAISLSHPFSLYLTFGRRIENGALIMRRFSTINERDDRDRALDEEVEKKAGWLLKAIFVVTAVGVAYQFFPYMGDNLLQQSISLLHVKDPLFKRMGASRLRRYAIDDGRRMRVVEMGGAHDLLSMLESAKDDKTRKEALKALLALSQSDAVLEILRHAGVAAIVAALPDSAELDELSKCKFDLLERVSREFDEQQPGLC